MNLNIIKLAKKIKTPEQMQSYIRGLRYNKADTLYSAEEAIRRKTAHCLEGAFIAAAVLEMHGFPPLVMSFESRDGIDHVIYLFKRQGRWGSVAQSRDVGLFGRAPVYRSLRDLAWSYYDPYVDHSGMITAYQLANLDDSKSPWRSSSRHVWKAETYLLEIPHIKIKASKARHQRLQRAHEKNGPMKPQENWW